MLLKGKVAIITGGTRGIGLAIVKKFADNGAKVILLGSRKETVDNALTNLKQQGYKEIDGYYPDLNSINQLQECFESVHKKYGKIDVLINNAGVASSTKLLDYSDSEADSIIDLNLKAVFNTCKVAVPYMEKGACIINTSSMVSLYGQASGVLYPATKFAVNGLTKSLARELAPKGIRVNAVAPGITETDMMKNLPKELITPLISKIPLGRIGTPEDIANGFVFLASDMASYITGEILQIDGGTII